jgi:hypothetical protein
MSFWAAFLVAIACAAYFGYLAWSSLLAGEIARFGPNVTFGFLQDFIADSYPDLRWTKYISREQSPVRFWIAIVIRGFLAALAAILAIAIPFIPNFR